MDDETVGPTAPEETLAKESSGTAKRERSSIEFPYSDLDNAIEIARAIFNRAGSSCEVKQLASWLDQSATGGTFRSRLSAARIFGLVETERGGLVGLTNLGRQILENDQERSARITAFLNVPLYETVYEQYHGHVLPPAAALERQIVSFGVSHKQSDRARQSFAKSAQQAGFIDPQTGRFIKPGISGDVLGSGGETSKADRRGSGGGGGSNGGPPTYHPFIEGLLSELPKAGDIWPIDARELWLSTAKSIFQMIYKEENKENPKVAIPGHGEDN